MQAVKLEDVVVGQYRGKGQLPGYLDDDTVPQNRWAAWRHALALLTWLYLHFNVRLAMHCTG